MPDSVFSIMIFLVFSFILIIMKLLQDKKWSKIIEQKFIPKEDFNTLQTNFIFKDSIILELQKQVADLNIEISRKEEQIRAQDEMIDYKMEEIEKIRQSTKHEFEVLAQKILDEKSQKFTQTNKTNIESLLQPLKENISQFESRIHQQISDEAKSRIELKKEIEHLQSQSSKITQEANNLAVAIKGDKKMLGNWGEIQLETILQHTGLVKNVHYRSQLNFKDDYGSDKRPDFLILLPDNKCLIIDSKVSLNAYEQYFNTSDDKDKAKYLQQHVQNIRNHIKGLGSKAYEHLPGLNNPEYVLLYIPLEPAFNAALQSDEKLFLEALDQNIVLVTSSTLMATMRTVYHIWRQQQQNMNASQIAKESGMLYDKFVGFIEDMKKIGSKIQESEHAYFDAMNKLTESSKKGDTIIGRVERIKKLGAKANKSLPNDLISDVELSDLEE
jgi:DNA recombination protein RmuC